MITSQFAFAELNKPSGVSFTFWETLKIDLRMRIRHAKIKGEYITLNFDPWFKDCSKANEFYEKLLSNGYSANIHTFEFEGKDNCIVQTTSVVKRDDSEAALEYLNIYRLKGDPDTILEFSLARE
jgi:hypothetical protein